MELLWIIEARFIQDNIIQFLKLKKKAAVRKTLWVE